MKAKVTEHGVLIPRDLLGDSQEVEIHREGTRVIISLNLEDDPVFGLGKEPVECGLPEASERHDSYIYGSGS
jgi:virulence-associated protein VagC